MHFYIWQ